MDACQKVQRDSLRETSTAAPAIGTDEATLVRIILTTEKLTRIELEKRFGNRSSKTKALLGRVTLLGTERFMHGSKKDFQSQHHAQSVAQPSVALNYQTQGIPTSAESKITSGYAHAVTSARMAGKGI